MKVEDLVRVKFEVSDEEISRERVALAEQAETLLSYSRMSLSFKKGTLLRVLMDKDIHPFTKSSVTAYMKSKERKGIASATKAALGFFAISVALFCFAFWVSSTVPPENTIWRTLNYFEGTSTVVLFSLSGICLIASCGFLFSTDRGTRTSWRWREISVRNYNMAIPEFALSKAIEIAKEKPEAKFYVEQLMKVEEKEEIPDRDPFLRVDLGNESYYIEVWDEKYVEEYIPV